MQGADPNCGLAVGKALDPQYLLLPFLAWSLLLAP
jgi:hypothetical protein